MVAILSMKDGKLKGWILAQDIHDARRQCPPDMDDLAAFLYRIEFDQPSPGRYELTDGYTMLVT